MTRQVYTVGQVNRYVKNMLEADPLLAGVFIEGELSNFNAHSSGHLYFTLKDSQAAIGGVMFKSHAYNLEFEPKNGMKVIVFGQINMFEKTGQYQLYAEVFEPAGIGAKALAFRQLKDKLEAEGLFDPMVKKPIPQYIKTVAVITSPTGAAVQDIIRTIKNRNASTQIIVVPAKVQGEGAATELALAIKAASRLKPDCIIIGRGGGSIEDLWAFNEEILARGIFACKVPIISAVGHETDFTIADFVADARAATPTAAAAMATFDHTQLAAYVKNLNQDLGHSILAILQAKKEALQYSTHQLSTQVKNVLKNKTQQLYHQQQLLEKVSPYAMFDRGFALVHSGFEKITAITQLKKSQRLTLTFKDGMAEVVVDNIYEDTTPKGGEPNA